MNKKISLIMCIVLVFATCIGMVSCSNRQKVADYTIKVADYAIVRDNGEYFIVFDDITLYNEIYSDGMLPVSSIEFPSMKAFRDALIEGTLTDSQKRTMATMFKKDESGKILLCDIDNLFVPQVPETCSAGAVYWGGGNSYTFDLSFDDGVYGSFRYLTENEYNSVYQRNYLDLFERENITVTSTEQLDDDKVAIYHSTRAGDLKNVRYSLSSGEKTLVVDKTYRLRMNNPELNKSPDVPSGIKLYCVDGEKRYIIVLYNFVEDPTDDWLLNFGIERFTDF